MASEPADGRAALRFCIRVARVAEQAVEGRAGRAGEPRGDACEQRVQGLAVQ